MAQSGAVVDEMWTLSGQEVRGMVVHPSSIRAVRPAKLSSSDPAIPRRPERSTYRCFLPDLTGFADICRVGTESS